MAHRDSGFHSRRELVLGKAFHFAPVWKCSALTNNRYHVKSPAAATLREFRRAANGRAVAFPIQGQMGHDRGEEVKVIGFIVDRTGLCPPTVAVLFGDTLEGGAPIARVAAGMVAS
jgi:hypothetical protein